MLCITSAASTVTAATVGLFVTGFSVLLLQPGKHRINVTESGCLTRGICGLRDQLTMAHMWEIGGGQRKVFASGGF